MSMNGVTRELSLREQIFGKIDLRMEKVEVPEWNLNLTVRGLTGSERDSYENSLMDQSGKKTKLSLFNARAKLVALCVVDEHGQRVFSDEDAGFLGTKSAAALDRIFSVAQELSGITDKDIEDTVGVLQSDPNVSSISDSPSPSEEPLTNFSDQFQAPS